LLIDLPAQSGKRMATLDELKGVAIVLIIVYHCTGLLGFDNLFQGQSGVDIFLVLSGLGLALSLKDEGTKEFLIRRLAALMPRYWTALALITVSNTLVLGHRDSVWDFGMHVLALHVIVPDSFYAIDGALWFMGMIIPLYGVAAALRPWLRAGLADRVIVSGLALTIVCHLLCNLNQADTEVIIPTVVVRIPEFFLGLATGSLLRHGSKDTTLATPVLAWAVLFYGLYAATVDPRLLTSANPAFGAVWSVWYLLLIVACAETPVRILRRMAKWTGTRSFELYLYHQPFMVDYNRHIWYQYNQQIHPTSGQLLVGIAIGFVLTVGVCLLAEALASRLIPASNHPGPRLSLAAGAITLFWIGKVIQLY